MNIGRECERGGVVPKSPLHLHRIATLREQHRSAGMTERMEARPGCPSLLGGRLEHAPAEIVWSENAPGCGREHRVSLAWPLAVLPMILWSATGWCSRRSGMVGRTLGWLRRLIFLAQGLASSRGLRRTTQMRIERLAPGWFCRPGRSRVADTSRILAESR